MIEIVLFGFIIGLWHAMDIDHIAAILTFIAGDNSSRPHSTAYGITWGLGHATMLTVVAIVTMAFNLRIGDEFAWLMEFLVAVMLVVLALDLFRRLAKVKVHSHEHHHGAEAIHTHAHMHIEGTAHASEGHTHRHYEGYLGRALLVGLVHGTAGSAALTLLVLQTINSKALGMVYIILFGVGSMMGMTLLTAIISAQLRRSHLGSGEWARALRGIAAVVTLSVGLFLMFKAGTSAGLFTMI